MSPNMATVPTADAYKPSASTACLHCGRALVLRTDEYCCNGCRQVYLFLHGEKLGRYYEILETQQKSAPTQEGEPYRVSETADLAAVFRWGANPHAYAFYVPSLTCAACLWLMQKALRDIAGVESIDVDLSRKLVHVRAYDDSPLVVPQLLERMRLLGYRALPPKLTVDAEFQDTVQRRRLVELGLAWAAFGNVMLFAAALYYGDLWGMSSVMARFLALFALAITTAALPTAGRSFFANAWRAVRTRSLHIDLPIALALLLAFSVSVASLIEGGTRVYFDSVTGLMALLLTGRYLSEMMAKRARDLAGSAESLVPPGSSAIKPGDTVIVRVGDAIPADGRVVSGVAEVSEAALTGEYMPLLKTPGEIVLAGSHNLTGSFTMTVIASGENSRMAQVDRLIADARAGRTKFEIIADRILRWFILGIFLAAVSGALIWWHVDPSRIVEVVCATLIVSCPCALALATPLVTSFALKRSWQHGVIVKSSDTFERLAKVSTIVVDKTGTLTTGAAQVIKQSGDELSPDFASMLREVTARSRHPVARAISSSLPREGQRLAFEVVSHRELPARGIEASLVVDGDDGETFHLNVGSIGWLQELHARDPKIIHALDQAASACAVVSPQVVGCVILGAQSQVIVAFALVDAIRTDASEVVAAWQGAGFKVLLMSGDSRSSVAKTAAAVGIRSAESFAEMTPEMKATHVRRLESAGERVLMIGDGVNDAPALAAATVGLAVRGGADVAIGAADAFCQITGLGPVEDLRAFAVYCMTSLKIVLGVSLAYNVVAVGMALSGFIHPIVAALIMPLSSISVIAVASMRGGQSIWTFSSSSCPLPSSL